MLSSATLSVKRTTGRAVNATSTFLKGIVRGFIALISIPAGIGFYDGIRLIWWRIVIRVTGGMEKILGKAEHGLRIIWARAVVKSLMTCAKARERSPKPRKKKSTSTTRKKKKGSRG